MEGGAWKNLADPLCHQGNPPKKGNWQSLKLNAPGLKNVIHFGKQCRTTKNEKLPISKKENPTAGKKQGRSTCQSSWSQKKWAQGGNPIWKQRCQLGKSTAESSLQSRRYKFGSCSPGKYRYSRTGFNHQLQTAKALTWKSRGPHTKKKQSSNSAEIPVGKKWTPQEQNELEQMHD